ncbi:MULTISPECIES: C39 family peptidase [Loigolactobacillus]|nr:MULTISPECIES: C39 family peptidase [Loigolactobacillus]MDA5387882.1 C39 family peptidase [Loigolactobacillus backii]MDA5390374.1 C39 family peptidase [Loigolactobacillus backii]
MTRKQHNFMRRRRYRLFKAGLIFSLVIIVSLITGAFSITHATDQKRAQNSQSSTSGVITSKQKTDAKTAKQAAIDRARKKAGVNQAISDAQQTAKTKAGATQVQLKAPALDQFPELPTGCEITAVAMLMQYKKVNISPSEIAQEIPYTDDPNTGFWGNPYDDTGYTMYPPAWQSFFESKVGHFKNLSGASIKTLKQTLHSGKPVVAWLYLHDFPAHAILLTGYDQNDFYYNDPFDGSGNNKIKTKTFWKLAATQNNAAMTY